MRLTDDKLLKNILDFYIKNYNRDTSESLYALRIMFENMPSLDSMYRLVSSRLFEKKELIVIKIILDIYEHYFKKYDYPLYHNLINEFIPTACLFYTILTDSDISHLNNIIKKKDLYEVLYDKMHMVKYKTSKECLKRLNKMRMEFLSFAGDNLVNKFLN